MNHRKQLSYKEILNLVFNKKSLVFVWLIKKLNETELLNLILQMQKKHIIWYQLTENTVTMSYWNNTSQIKVNSKFFKCVRNKVKRSY